jgi:hypothetical protein
VAVRFPGLLPGLRKLPVNKVTPPTLPDPPREAPELTVIALAVLVPFTSRVPAEIVVAPE